MHTSALSLAGWGLVFSAASAAASNVHIAPRATQAPSTTAANPEVTAITGCHLHASELFCVDSNGADVSVQAEGAESEEDEDHDHEEASGTGSAAAAGNTKEAENEHCHFHAGVE
ncbi:hypothetical protein LB505_004663 [Fusarium chuoi]|nr:hypothetical protein LB505_004663 [Fusarium chuoi]